MSAVGQPVAVFGRAGAPKDALDQFGVAGAEPRSLFGPGDAAKERLIFEDDGHRHWRRYVWSPGAPRFHRAVARRVGSLGSCRVAAE